VQRQQQQLSPPLLTSTMGKGRGDPNKIHDDGVEIPETAHQISTGLYLTP